MIVLLFKRVRAHLTPRQKAADAPRFADVIDRMTVLGIGAAVLAATDRPRNLKILPRVVRRIEPKVMIQIQIDQIKLLVSSLRDAAHRHSECAEGTADKQARCDANPEPGLTQHWTSSFFLPDPPLVLWRRPAAGGIAAPGLVRCSELLLVQTPELGADHPRKARRDDVAAMNEDGALLSTGPGEMHARMSAALGYAN
jgi:hypothetical protein